MFTGDVSPAVCTLQADFSRLIGESALPCRIVLDAAHSAIDPAAGESQRFVYRIIPTGPAANGLRTLFFLPGRVSAADFASVRVFSEQGPLPGTVRMAEGGRALLIDHPLSQAEGPLRVECTLVRIHPATEAAVGFLGRDVALPITSAGYIS